HTRSKRDWSSDVCSSDLIIRFIAFTTNLAKAINASINGPIAVITALNIDTANPKAGTSIEATIIANVSTIGHKSWNNPNNCSNIGAAESSNESNALFNASKNGCILSISVPRISNTEETTSSTVPRAPSNVFSNTSFI